MNLRSTDHIKIVDDLSWFDINTLNGLDDIIVKIFSDSEYTEGKRYISKAKAVTERTGQVERPCKNAPIIV